ncbi:hypothetical protein C8R44DRAFT_888518 [Mycena epipterygia]|nr:hypothetical protein C8R44DRAFT_888518 [Mycena epipterygia]
MLGLLRTRTFTRFRPPLRPLAPGPADASEFYLLCSAALYDAGAQVEDPTCCGDFTKGMRRTRIGFQAFRCDLPPFTLLGVCVLGGPTGLLRAPAAVELVRVFSSLSILHLPPFSAQARAPRNPLTPDWTHRACFASTAYTCKPECLLPPSSSALCALLLRWRVLCYAAFYVLGVREIAQGGHDLDKLHGGSSRAPDFTRPGVFVALGSSPLALVIVSALGGGSALDAGFKS